MGFCMFIVDVWYVDVDRRVPLSTNLSLFMAIAANRSGRFSYSTGGH